MKKKFIAKHGENVMDILRMMKSIKNVKMTEEMKQRIIDNISSVISNSETGENLIDKDVKENTEQ